MQKNFQNPGVELLSLAFLQFQQDILEGHHPPMRPRTGHRIERIWNSDDPCLKRNGLTHQSIRISTPVEMLMVMTNHGNLILKKIDPFHNLDTDQWMFLNVLILFGIQGTRLLEHFVLDADLTDVMKERSIFQTLQPIFGKTKLKGDLQTHPCHSIG